MNFKILIAVNIVTVPYIFPKKKKKSATHGGVHHYFDVILCLGVDRVHLGESASRCNQSNSWFPSESNLNA